MTNLNTMRNRAAAREQADSERARMLARLERITEARDALNTQLAKMPTGMNHQKRIEATLAKFWKSPIYHEIQTAYNAITPEPDHTTAARRHQLENNK